MKVCSNHKFKLISVAIFGVLAVALLFSACSSVNKINDAVTDTSPVKTMPVSDVTETELFEADTFTELKALVDNKDCKKIFIEGDILLTENIVFDRLIDLSINGTLVSDGFSVTVKSLDTLPVNIDVSSGSKVSLGAIIINSPYSDVLWRGEEIPGIEFVLENMNVRSFNGTNLKERQIGGAGKAFIEDIYFADNNGKKIDGSTYIVKGNVITLNYPFALDEKRLKELKTIVSAADCSEWKLFETDGTFADVVSSGKRYILTLNDKKGEKRGYFLDIKRACKNLPVLSVYTDGGKVIDSKETYIKGFLDIDCGGSERYAGFSLNGKTVGIKGRGNASWNNTDKKSYRLKFDEKVSVLGLEADKDWVLVSNYFDKSLVRNIVAHELAKQMENLEYTPTHIPVDLFINGEYRGVYTIADKIEVSKKKINIETSEEVENPGFLIEIGWDYDSENVYGKDYFDVDIIKRLYVKEPDITEKYNNRIIDIIEYVKAADKAISSRQGYEQYIDVDSMVDWFIIAELTNNTEMAFYRSCYFYKPANGKIKMGPVWDFDMAFGNFSGDIKNYDGWSSAESEFVYVNDTWTTYLIKDKKFMDKVKARWNEKKDILISVADSVLSEAYNQIGDSAAENFIKWDILDKKVGEGTVDYSIYDTHEKQVQYVREFIKQRAEWLSFELDK